MKKNDLTEADLRRKAEAKLSKQKETLQPPKKADNLRLVHELQVHQIELEMQNEQLLQSQAEVDAGLKHYTELYNDLYDFAPIGYFTITRDGIIRKTNLYGAHLLGKERGELINRRFVMFVSEESRPSFTEFLENVFKNWGKQFCDVALKNGQEILWTDLEATCSEDGQECRAIAIDITERKQAEEKIQRQIKYLTALRDIDQTIATTFDMNLSLNTLLSRVVTLLKVDAAAIMLVDVGLGSLEYVTGHGFRTRAVETVDVKLGRGYAGRVAVERRLIQIPNLADEPDSPLLDTFLKEEKFVSYCGVPLIAKGKIIGVLELFHRTAMEYDQEWIDFLATISGQAALAIHDAQLFTNLQNSNIDLSTAYDAAIVGWSRAMDLRDKEAEDHSQRVTAMTLELARKMQIDKSQMMYIRHGALLHDIGKLGVPDSILLKPDKLTDEEWESMHQHPTFAYDLLSSIANLNLALDIPYCHHEKWDGTGYPRGLKGEQIPLAARLFAIVDVWDALRSDRPYRAGWSEEDALAYIRAQSGKHFDPEVVGMFLSLHSPQ